MPFPGPCFCVNVTGSYVKELVASKSLVVFSKSYCPYCTKAKKSLSAVGAKDYEVTLYSTSSSSNADFVVTNNIIFGVCRLSD